MAVYMNSMFPGPIIKMATEFLELYKDFVKTKKLAIVFDIDETILTVKRDPDMVERDLKMVKRNPGNPGIVEIEEVKLLPMKQLYNVAKTLGYNIFFITARLSSVNNEIYTINQLKKYGFTKYKGLQLMSIHYYSILTDWSIFKWIMRRRISEDGYNILFNVGNEWSDLVMLPPTSLHHVMLHGYAKLLADNPGMLEFINWLQKNPYYNHRYLLLSPNNPLTPKYSDNFATYAIKVPK